MYLRLMQKTKKLKKNTKGNFVNKLAGSFYPTDFVLKHLITIVKQNYSKQRVMLKKTILLIIYCPHCSWRRNNNFSIFMTEILLLTEIVVLLHMFLAKAYIIFQKIGKLVRPVPNVEPSVCEMMTRCLFKKRPEPNTPIIFRKHNVQQNFHL